MIKAAERSAAFILCYYVLRSNIAFVEKFSFHFYQVENVNYSVLIEISSFQIKGYFGILGKKPFLKENEVGNGEIAVFVNIA